MKYSALRFDLTDAEPSRARTVTQGYRFPPAKPDVPPADRCSRDDLLQLAADAMSNGDDLWSLLGSREHVRAICRLLVEQIEPESRAADEQIRALQSKAAETARLLERTERVVVTLCHDLYATQRAYRTEQVAHIETIRRVAGKGQGHE